MILFPLIVPDFRKRLQREIAKTQHELLDAQDAQAVASNNVSFYSKRLAYLKAELEAQPQIRPLQK